MGELRHVLLTQCTRLCNVIGPVQIAVPRAVVLEHESLNTFAKGFEGKTSKGRKNTAGMWGIVDHFAHFAGPWGGEGKAMPI